MQYPTEVTGDHTGILFPVSYEKLEAGGASALTRLFRQSGAIAGDDRVTEILHWKEFFGGGMGRKIAIDVAYEHSSEAPTRLFAKFTRAFGDPLRDLFSPVMDPEVRFALLSRKPGFPLRVPRCMFADYNAEFKSGLLITERIPYGSEGVEPVLDKCLDYELPDTLPHYEAQARAIAALAAYHKAGHFGSEIDREFPFNPHDEALLKIIPYNREELAGKLIKLKEFARRAPQLLPDGIADLDFLEEFSHGVMEVLAKERAILQTLYTRKEAIALVHWNMNLDNAWFWRGDDGVLRSGQLDWGGVAQANIAQSYYGMLCAAEPDFTARNDAHLQKTLLSEYAALGGPQLDPVAFDQDLKLSIAVLGVAWMLDAPSLVEAELPNYSDLTDKTDPRLRTLFLPRAQLGVMNLFMSEWRRKNIGGAITQIQG